jgi:hypothetical protein
MFLDRQKGHAYGVCAGVGEFETQLGALFREELVGNLEENASAISGFGIASACAAVGQVEQDLDSLLYDLVAFVAEKVGHESDAAGVVLVRRMVQTLGGGRAVRLFSTRRHGRDAAYFAASRSVVLEVDLARQGNGSHASAQERSSATY